MGKRTQLTSREALVSELRDRLIRTSSPRLTILFVLTLSGGAAFLTSFAGLAAGIDSMAVRYALASIAGYLAFVVLIRVWIGIRRGWQAERDFDIPDPFGGADLAELGGRGVGRGVEVVKSFAGGKSGGGGGGATWIAEPVERAAAVRGASSSVAGDALEGVGGSLDLDDGAVIVFIVIAVLAALGGILCIGYVIYIAPMLLAEVALDAALVSAVYRRLRKEDVGHWTGAVFRRTWMPAAILVIFMAIAGYAAQRLAPEARSIGGVIRALFETSARAQPVERSWSVNHGLTRERIVGLIELAPFVSDCDSDKPALITLYDTPSAARPSSGQLELGIASEEFPGAPCVVDRVAWRRTGARSAEQALTEESGYEIPALIAYERAGPWFRIALPRGSAWIRNKPRNIQSYPQLLTDDRLTHMASGWDGTLWSTPGAPSARPVSSTMKRVIQEAKDAPREVDVDVLAIRHVAGEPWIQVRVVDGHCEGADPVKIESGWVPAHRPTREPSVWFYSRGC